MCGLHTTAILPDNGLINDVINFHIISSSIYLNIPSYWPAVPFLLELFIRSSGASCNLMVTTDLFHILKSMQSYLFPLNFMICHLSTSNLIFHT